MGYRKTNFSKTTWEICTHPFEISFIPPSADKLIIGSFPTREVNYRSTFNFFYGGETNRFWEIMSRIDGKQFKHSIGEKAVEERKRFLEKYNLGITDMLVKCYRKNQSSTDNNLYPIKLNDIYDLLLEHPPINKIILTSLTTVYGALGLFETYFMQKDMELNGFVRNGQIKETFFHIGQRRINVVALHSPSRTNEHVTDDELFDMYYESLK